MKNQLTSLELSYVIKELKVLIEGRIDKIFQRNKQEFYFQFYATGAGKKVLKVTDKLMYFTDSKPSIEEPPDFCMYLRKQLSNARIREINQKESERIVEFVFERKDGFKKMIVEIFGGGNLLLLDQDDIILSAAHYEKYKDRDVLARKKYDYPRREYNFFDISKEELKELFSKSNKQNIVKSLATDLGMGGTYSEEVCIISGVDKNKKPNEADSEDIDRIHKAIDDIMAKKEKAVIVYDKKEAKDVNPFNLRLYEGLETKEFEDYNGALDYYFTNEADSNTNEKTPMQANLEKIQRIIAEQKRKIESMGKGESENREKAEAIYSNYQTIKDILEEISKARKRLSEKEIKEKLKNHKLIKDVDFSQNRIVIDL